uniref:FAST kinase-like protein subdomain 2 domain-containing protein n=1 Tax=Arion vulgaris TaxID=1028688 RepID=A0A0B7AXC1_9EUPU
MMSRHITVWTQRFLQQFGYTAHKCQCSCINFHHLTASSAFRNLQNFSLKNATLQDYSHESNIKNCLMYTTDIKDGPRTQHVLSIIDSLKETGSRSIKPDIYKPQNQRMAWLKDMHRLLMKSVVFKPEKQDLAEFSKKAPHSFSTNALMSMAWDIQQVDKETMKIIVALWRRFDSMTVEEILTTADIFFYRGVTCQWYTSAMISYAEEIFELLSFTPPQLTRLVFHISNHGSAPPALWDNIEKRLLENLSDFDINLLAIICQLCFTDQSRIKSPILVDKIASKLLENLSSLRGSYLQMMMKMLRFSNYIKISFYQQLGDKLITSKYFKEFHTPSEVMHIAFAYASVRMTHPELFQSILKYCLTSRHQFRLKDMAKLVWACGTLVTTQEKNIAYVHDILLKLQRNIAMNDIQKYPDSLLDLLMGLALLNIYPHHFINIAFDPAILKVLLGLPPEREKFFQLMFLDNSLSIECPNYSGFRLTEAEYASVALKVSGKCLELDMEFRKSVKPALSALVNLLGSDYVQCKFVLPHCRTSDIVLAYDMDKKIFVKPVSKPLRSTNNADEHSCNKSIQDVALLLLSRMQTSFNDQPLGVLYCKIRQLQAVGYKVIPVDANEAMSYTFLDMETTQRLLLDHISAALGTDVSKVLHSKYNG